MKKRSVMLIVLLVLCVILGACGAGQPQNDVSEAAEASPAEDETANPTADLLGSARNDLAADEMIKATYSMDDLDLEKLIGQTIAAVNDSFPIECLREKDGYYYAVYALQEKKYRYVIFEYNDQAQAYLAATAFSVSFSSQKEAFLHLVPGESTLEDVYRIDPAPVILAGGNGDQAQTAFSDGTVAVVRFSQGAKNSLIESVDMVDLGEDSMPGQWLLPIDIR